MAAKREVGLRAIINPDFSEASAALSEMTKVAGKEISDVLSKAGDAFLSPKKMLAMRKSMLNTSHEISRLQAAGDRKGAAAQTIRLQAMIKTNEKIIRKNDESLKGWQDITQKSAKDWTEGVTGGMKSAFDGLKSGDLTGLFSNALQGALKTLPGLAKGARMKADESGGAGIGKLATFLEMLGPIAIGIGLVVGAFTAMAGLIMEADSSVKAFNADLMNTGVTIGDMTTDLWAGTEAFNKYRDTASQLSKDLWLTKEEINQIVGGFNDGSKTLKELTKVSAGAKNEQEALSQNIQASVKWARLLNMSYKESAEMMATQSEELGTTIEGVGKRFGAVYDAAQLSGFSVKRFFNMVLQATSGMQMYNMKLEESAGLLLMLSKILGSKMGGEFLQSLSKKYTEESYQDAYKGMLTTTKGVTLGNTKHSAKNASEDIVQKFGEQLKDMGPEQAERFKDVFKMAGIKGVDTQGLDADATAEEKTATSKSILEALKNLSPDQQSKLYSAVQAKGNAEMAQKFDGLVHLAEGTTGNDMALAASRKYQGNGDKLVSELHSGFAVLHKPLWELTKDEKMNAEGVTGKSRAELDELIYVGKSIRGNFLNLQDLQETGQKFTEKQQQQQLKDFGAYIDENGKMVTGVVKGEGDDAKLVKTGDVDNTNDLIRAAGDRFSSLLAEPMSKQDAAAEAVRDNTIDMAQMMKIYGEFLMNQIYDVLVDIREGIFGFVGEDKATTAKNRAKADKEERTKISALAEERKNKDRKVSDLRNKLKTAAKGADRLKLAEELEAAEKDLEAADVKEVQAKEEGKLIKKANTETDVTKGVMNVTKGTPEDGFGWGDAVGLATNVIPGLNQALGIGSSLTNQFRTEAPIESFGESADMMKLSSLRDASEVLMGDDLADLDEKQLEQLAESAGLDKESVAYLAALDKTYNRVAKDAAAGSITSQKKMIDFQSKEFPSYLAKEIVDEQEKAKLIGAMASAGVDRGDAEDFADSIIKDGKLPSELAAKLMANPDLRGKIQEGDLGRNSSLFDVPHENDFLLRMDGKGRVTPVVGIDPADNLSVIGTKAGGAAQQAGGSARATSGGGVQVIHNHFYNDARANFQQTQKILKSMRK